MRNLCLCLLAAIVSAAPSQCPQNIDPSSYKKTFGDDFDTFSWYGKGGTWKTWFYFAWDQTDPNGRTLSGNGELEYYSDAGTGYNNPFWNWNGFLIINATNNQTDLPKNDKGIQLLYCSGLITTEPTHSQTYGYFEMSAKLPYGKGFWPAFWLLSVDKQWPPEMDPLEAFGAPNSRGEGDPHTYHLGRISNDDGGWGNWYKTPNGADITQDQHKYGFLWTNEVLCYYFDRILVDGTTTPADMHKPMYMLANLAVGGSWPENPDQYTPFPAEMLIDYIYAFDVPTELMGQNVEIPVQRPGASFTSHPSLTPTRPYYRK